MAPPRCGGVAFGRRADVPAAGRPCREPGRDRPGGRNGEYPAAPADGSGRIHRPGSDLGHRPARPSSAGRTRVGRRSRGEDVRWRTSPGCRPPGGTGPRSGPAGRTGAGRRHGVDPCACRRHRSRSRPLGEAGRRGGTNGRGRHRRGGGRPRSGPSAGGTGGGVPDARPRCCRTCPPSGSDGLRPNLLDGRTCGRHSIVAWGRWTCDGWSIDSFSSSARRASTIGPTPEDRVAPPTARGRWCERCSLPARRRTNGGTRPVCGPVPPAEVGGDQALGTAC